MRILLVVLLLTLAGCTKPDPDRCLVVVWSDGLQSNDPAKYSNRAWERQGGRCIVNKFMGMAEMPEWIRANDFDVATLSPSLMPELAADGVLAQIDVDLGDILPAYSQQGVYDGRQYGTPDDGDVWILYYRQDVFDELGLEVPTTWAEFDEVGRQITEADIGIRGSIQARRGEGSHLFFENQLHAAGGSYFDGRMKATVNSPIAHDLVNRWIDQEAWMVHKNHRSDVYGMIQAYLRGDVAMVVSWPPVGRFSAGITQDQDVFATMPHPAPAVKLHTSYALSPGTGQRAIGFVLSISDDTELQAEAQDYVEWVTSPEISLKRVKLPYALRDPYRISHFEDDGYRSMWHNAADYLDTLREAAETSNDDMALIGQRRYNASVRMHISHIFDGDDVAEHLDLMAADFDKITADIGIKRQRKLLDDDQRH